MSKEEFKTLKKDQLIGVIDKNELIQSIRIYYTLPNKEDVLNALYHINEFSISSICFTANFIRLRIGSGLVRLHYSDCQIAS